MLVLPPQGSNQTIVPEVRNVSLQHPGADRIRLEDLHSIKSAYPAPSILNFSDLIWKQGGCSSPGMFTFGSIPALHLSLS